MVTFVYASLNLGDVTALSDTTTSVPRWVGDGYMLFLKFLKTLISARVDHVSTQHRLSGVNDAFIMHVGSECL